MEVLVKFWHLVYDNYQGASGKVMECEKIITVDNNLAISRLRDEIIYRLKQLNYHDSWVNDNFSGHGIISISIF